ncbi:glycosyltransferase family 4 protein [Alphaproteobacteria bacterium]|nr:glycosyltransferase family 4 protein [Alphaproteobacteria bacterium]
MKNSNKRLRFGVDVSCLTGHLTGIGKYTYQVLSQLHLSKEFEIYYYSYQKPNKINLQNLHFHKSRFMSFHKHLRLLWTNFNLPSQLKIDKIDVFWFPSPRIPLFLPKNVKTIVTIHDFVYKFVPHTMKFYSLIMDQLYVPFSIKKSSKIICISQSTRKDLSVFYPDHYYKSFMIGVGISKKTTISKNLHYKKYILFVGTIEPRKNILTLIKAYKLLPVEIRADHKLIIAGHQGWGAVNISETIKKYNLIKDVIYLKSVKDDELTYLYKNAICFVFPSLYEGLGIPLLEAMVSGLPIISSKINSSQEITNNCGYYFESRNIKELHSIIKRVLLDKKIRSEMSVLSLKQAKTFDWEKVNKKFRDLIIS